MSAVVVNNAEVNTDAVLLPDAQIFRKNDQVVFAGKHGAQAGVVVEIDYDRDITWLYVRYATMGWDGTLVTDRMWLTVSDVAAREEFEGAGGG